MKIQEQIDEILGYFKEDCSYVAITGTILKKDIDIKLFKIEEVEEQSFDHTYGVVYATNNMEDYYNGTTYVPVGTDVYLQCEWSS
jgi:hypothetical protein